MQERMRKAKEFINLSVEWNENVCIYGAGCYGTGWAYELIGEYAGMNVDFYVDRNKVGQIVNDIAIRDIEYLKDRKDTTLCFIALAEGPALSVYEELENIGIKHIFILSEPSFIHDLTKYIHEYCDSKIAERYNKLIDDKLYLTRNFKKRLGYELDIENPKTFNEKLQWIKVNDRRNLLCRKNGIIFLEI